MVLLSVSPDPESTILVGFHQSIHLGFFFFAVWSTLTTQIIHRMKRRRKSAALWLALSICAFLPQTLADCECGYSVVTGDGDNDNDGGTHVFTDLLEADFVHVDYVEAGATTKDWATQTYNMSSQAARGSYGESFGAAEVDKDLVEDANIWTGDGADGDDVGLKLMVRSETVDGMIEGGQVATTAGDYFWGSYRASIKVTAVQASTQPAPYLYSFPFSIQVTWTSSCRRVHLLGTRQMSSPSWSTMRF